MKQMIKYTLTIAALLLVTMGAMADGAFTVIKKIDGAAAGNNNPGKVIYDGNGKITVTPNDGYYLTLEDLTVIKTLNGQYAEGRTREPGYENAPIALTPVETNPDPSGETNYTFDVTDPKYDYQITANFHQRTSVENATVDVLGGPFTYTGEPIKPGVQVKVGTTTLTLNTDYKVYYNDSIDAGTGKIIVDGIRKYWKLNTSATYSIGKAAGTVSFETGRYDKTIGDDDFAQEATVTGDGTVAYTTSNENVASVNGTTGVVKINGIGNATITATVTEKDGGNYSYATKTATYTITVSRAKGEGYGLWIGDTQVTAENADDILKDGTTGETSKSGSFVFNPKNNYLFINYEGKEGEEDLSIESRLPELVIYIRNEVGNKLKRIFYNNVDDAKGSKPGKLVFTTYYNVTPGKLFLANEEGESAIWGFSSVNYASELAVIEPDGVCYNNQQLEWTKNVEGVEVICPANEVTIARPLETTKKVTVKLSDYVQRDDEGVPMTNEDLTPKIVSLKNTIINNLLHVLAKSDDPDSDEGFDDSDGVEGITVEGLMTDKKVGNVAGKVVNSDLVPGGSALAEEYNGFILLPSAGKGTISTTLKVDPGYAFHLAMEKDIKYEKDEDSKLIISDDDKPFTEIHELSNGNNSARGKVKKAESKDVGNGYVEVTIDYDSPEPSYCYLYLVKTNEASGARSIVPVGKRDKAHGKVVSINVNIVKKSSGNPPYIGSDGVIPNMEDPDDDDDIITGIKVINNTDHSRVGNNKWYNLNGQQIDLPTKQGLYIINGKKIILK